MQLERVFLFRLLVTSQDQHDVYQVNESGFLECQVERTAIRHRPQLTGMGASLNATSLVTVVTPRDQLRHQGSYYFIG